MTKNLSYNWTKLYKCDFGHTFLKSFFTQEKKKDKQKKRKRKKERVTRMITFGFPWATKQEGSCESTLFF